MSKLNVAKQERGNTLVIVLVVLIIAAVGALAFMSGKMGQAPEGQSAQTAQADKPAEGVQATDPVVAKVDGEDVKRSEVIQLVNMMPPQMQQIPVEQLLPIAIEQIVNNKIIDKKSVNAGLDGDPEVLKQLQNAKQQIIRAKYVENQITAKLDDATLKSKYADYVKNFPNVQEVKAAHILVEKEAKANEIIKSLEEGKTFADLAKENSKDGTAQNGGELGYFTEQDVVPEFAKAAFSTKPGDYTKKPVKSQFGYHIIKVEDKRKRPPAEFEQAKGFIEQEARREILDGLINDWKASAKIERFDINGNPLPEKQEPAAGDPAQDSASKEPAKAAEIPADSEKKAE